MYREEEERSQDDPTVREVQRQGASEEAEGKGNAKVIRDGAEKNAVRNVAQGTAPEQGESWKKKRRPLGFGGGHRRAFSHPHLFVGRGALRGAQKERCAHHEKGKTQQAEKESSFPKEPEGYSSILGEAERKARESSSAGEKVSPGPEFQHLVRREGDENDPEKGRGAGEPGHFFTVLVRPVAAQVRDGCAGHALSPEEFSGSC